MTPVWLLWPPILLAAVLVFVASSVLHMVLAYHRSDYRMLAREDEVMAALRPFGIPPGDYMMPCPGGRENMRSPAFLAKLSSGPVALFTVMRNGPPSMVASLVQWFVFCVIVGVIAAYIAGRALPPGAAYLDVFRFAGATSFTGYALALWQDSIWYSRSWTTTLKSTGDGLVYSLLTAGVFGWLWPAA
jgi:hypothetical protein